MNERKTQNMLFHHYMRIPTRTQFAVLVPNFKGAYAHGYECDLFGIDWGGHVWEWEIKRSEYDLRRDFTEKSAKHSLLRKSFRSKEEHNVPKRFYFVLSDFTVELNTIPEYIGVITIFGGTHLRVVRDAPDLSARRVSGGVLLKAATSLTWRYWKTRVERGLFRGS